ncbi:hypothetical protein B0H11DRAFT_2007028 [Mycena galericulata]|nr:hypothetical protein B0H11DRAFT_2007028 [Mycena galericulata]
MQIAAERKQRQKRAREYFLALDATKIDPVDTYLITVPITKVDPRHEVLVNAWTRFRSDKIEGDYRDPDTFYMWMQVQTPAAAELGVTWSPMVLLAHYLVLHVAASIDNSLVRRNQPLVQNGGAGWYRRRAGTDNNARGGTDGGIGAVMAGLIYPRATRISIS